MQVAKAVFKRKRNPYLVIGNQLIGLFAEVDFAAARIDCKPPASPQRGAPPHPRPSPGRWAPRLFDADGCGHACGTLSAQPGSAAADLDGESNNGYDPSRGDLIVLDALPHVVGIQWHVPGPIASAIQARVGMCRLATRNR